MLAPLSSTLLFTLPVQPVRVCRGRTTTVGRLQMVSGALAIIGINTGMNRESFWGLAFVTTLVDATLFYFYL